MTPKQQTLSLASALNVSVEIGGERYFEVVATAPRGQVFADSPDRFAADDDGIWWITADKLYLSPSGDWASREPQQGWSTESAAREFAKSVSNPTSRD